MARRNKQNRPEVISGGYSAIPWAVLDSLSFTGATDKAKALLFALMRQHNGSNNGHLHLARTWLASHGWRSDDNNRKACHELIERGLIVHTKFGGLNIGANLYALTWHDITNYVGLDITAKSYHRGAYLLCKLQPTQRRAPPVLKQKMPPDYRASTCPTTGQVTHLACPTIGRVMPVLDTFTCPTTGHNVITPLPVTNLTNA